MLTRRSPPDHWAHLLVRGRPSTDGTLGGMKRDATHHQLGEFLRAQRELANLSIRQLARLANVSDSYLSQVERVCTARRRRS